MSLYKSVLDTLYTDVSRMERAFMGKVLHGATEPSMKDVGQTSSFQWTRLLMEAINIWCHKNPDSNVAPQSFMPEFNDDIKDIISQGVSGSGVASPESSSDSTAVTEPAAPVSDAVDSTVVSSDADPVVDLSAGE